MKKVLAVLILGFSVSVMANAGGVPVTPKLRDAKVRAVVTKQFIKKTDGGGVEIRTEKVCSTEFTVGVYDTRNDGLISFGNGAECGSTLKGQPVRVNVNGFMTLGRYSFADESPIDIKGANLFLVTRDKEEGDHQTLLPTESAYSATPDLSARSIILHAQHTMWAGEGSFANDEQFSVTAEFVDDQQ